MFLLKCKNDFRHVEAFHSGLQFKCRECDHVTTTLQNLRAHRKKVGPSITVKLALVCTWKSGGPDFITVTQIKKICLRFLLQSICINLML